VEPAIAALRTLGGFRTAIEVAAHLGCPPRDAGTVLAQHVQAGRVEKQKVEGADALYRVKPEA
jgi:hypothetical protein